MWYYRNIVYWLIPAGRHHVLWWHALDDLVKRPRLAEELGMLRDAQALRNLRFDHYLYFGQLAEAYLSEARGHCASYTGHRILYKPKIPWWEWIQAFVDVWDPVQKFRGFEDRRRLQWLGALGAGPRPELAATLTMGAAIVTAAANHKLLQNESEARIAKALDASFTEFLTHAVGEFRKAIAAGAAVEKQLAKAVSLEAR
jgi:hypothetical protein